MTPDESRDNSLRDEPRSAETGDGHMRGFDVERFQSSVQDRRSKTRKFDPQQKTPLRPSGHVHVRAYSAPEWFTPVGVAKKRKLIEGKGLPSFKGWRFITLTLNRDHFDHDPLAAYLAGKAKVRVFMQRCRNAGIWNDDARWCWKMEFQADGWAHWHLWVDRKTRIGKEGLEMIRQFWGLGRTNVKMVRNDDMRYEFKYAFKPARQSEESDLETDGGEVDCAAPAWFLDHFRISRPGTKPECFARVRFWQTSKRFYTGVRPEAEAAGPPQSCILPQPARQVMERRASTVQVVARNLSGKYVASTLVCLSCFVGQFWDRVGWDAIHREAVGLGVNSYLLPTETLKQHISWLTPQLNWTLANNRLRLSRGRILQREGVTLRTC